MSEFTTMDFQGSVNFSRGPELISIGDGDIVSFVPDVLTNGANSSMNVGSGLYISDSDDDIEAGHRVMMWGRMSSASGDMAGPLRWLAYFTPDGATAGNAGNKGDDSIAVLRDVFCPRVTYDKQNNRLGLWFWTNVKTEYDGAIYDPSQLHTFITCENSISPSGIVDAKRVLCHAVGSFYHESITGGEITGLGSPGSSPNDIIPIFNTPQIITVGNGAQTGVMMDSMPTQMNQKITEPLRCRWLYAPYEKFTLKTNESPCVDPMEIDEFEVIEGTIKLPHADYTYGEFMEVDPIPTDGVPTFVYIKIDDWCSTSPLGNLIMFDVEKTEAEMKTDLNDNDAWWIKLAKIELVAPGELSEDLQYLNWMSPAGLMEMPPTSWNHWYIQTFELPDSVPEGRRIQTGEGAAAPSWFAKATAAGSGDFSGEIYGNGPDVAATITGVTIKNPTGVEVESGDLITVLEYCGDFFLTKKGAGGGGDGGSCVEIVFDSPLLLAKDMIPTHVVLRGHTEPNDYNMVPFQLDGTSVLIPELCIIRRNTNPDFDDMMPENLTGNPEYLDNEFCVIVNEASIDSCGGPDGSLAGLTGCCTGQPGTNPNEWIVAVTMECAPCATGATASFMGEPLMDGLSAQEKNTLMENALHKLEKNNVKSGGCCPTRKKS